MGKDMPIHPATSVRDLGVVGLLDSKLTMSKHVSKVASICFFNSAMYDKSDISSVAIVVRTLATRLLQLCSGRSSLVHY